MNLLNQVNLEILRNFAGNKEAQKILLKFERYYGTIPTEGDLHYVYKKYRGLFYNKGNPFTSGGSIKSGFAPLNCPKMNLRYFKIIEDYLLTRKIVDEKFRIPLSVF